MIMLVSLFFMFRNVTMMQQTCQYSSYKDLRMFFNILYSSTIAIQILKSRFVPSYLGSLYKLP